MAAIAPAVPAILNDGKAGVQEMIAKVAGKLAIKEAGDRSSRSLPMKRPAPERVAAIQALATLKDGHLSQIAKLAISDKDSKVRTEGLAGPGGR